MPKFKLGEIVTIFLSNRIGTKYKVNGYDARCGKTYLIEIWNGHASIEHFLPNRDLSSIPGCFGSSIGTHVAEDGIHHVLTEEEVRTKEVLES